MASPILYDTFSDGTDGLGLGVLSDTISCVVTEELNGIFELNMTYPMNGILFDELEINRIIKVDAGHQLKEQLFRIEKIETDSSGVARIYAPHVSSILRHIHTKEMRWFPIMGGFSDVGTHMMELWNEMHLTPSPFTVSSDFTFGNSHFTRSFTTTNARDGLNAIREGWGGDFTFNNYHIHYDPLGRGWRSNEIIAYGKNLKGFKKDINLIDVFTAVLPIARRNDQRVEGSIVKSPDAHLFPHDRIKIVDFSDHFNETGESITSARLRILGENYVANQLNQNPNISIEIDFIGETTLNEWGFSRESLALGNYLKIYFENSKTYEEARVVRVEWDVLMERYKKLEVGTISQRFRDGIKRIVGN